MDDLSPSDQSPVIRDSSTQRDLLSLLRTHLLLTLSPLTHRLRQRDLRRVVLHAHHASARARGANVHHQHLALRQLLHLRLPVRLLLRHAQQSPQQVEGDADLREHARQLALVAQHLSHQSVRARQRGVDLRSHADQSSRHRISQRVLLRVQRLHARVDRRVGHLALRVLAHDAGQNLDLVAETQDALEDGAAGDTALEVVGALAGLVDVEGADDDHVGRAGVVADGDGDRVHDVLADHVDVVLQLRTDGDDRSLLCHRAGDEVADALELDHRLLLLDQVDLVLQNDQVLQLHDLHGSEVLARLRLRAGLVSGDQQESRVHHSRSVQHRRHQHVVARTVHERHVAHQSHRASATRALALGMGLAV